MMAVVMIFIVSVYIYFDKNKPAGPQGGTGPASVSTRPSLETYLKAGREHLERGRYEEALSAFQNALSSDPQNFEAQLSLALALEKLDRPDEAIQGYEKAVALNSADSRPYLYLGEIYDRSNNEEKAMSAFRRFLDLAPDSDNARRVRRRIEEVEEKLLAQNRPEAKTAIPAKALPEEKAASEEKKPPGKTPPAAEPKQITPQIQPPKVDLDQLFSNGIQALKQKEYQVCITRMETILRYDPDHSQARYYLAVAQKSMEGEERRKTQEERLAREIQDKLGMVDRDLQAGKYQESIDRAQDVLRLDPDNARAREYINSATIKMARGQIQSVVDRYIQSVKNKNLVSFYQTHCIPALFQKIRKDTETTLKLYDDFQALASNVKSDVRRVGDNQYEARVSFNHILTGISSSRQTREVLFEGTISWIMEKRNDSWRIREIGYSTTGK
jgi:tetratricopeptide (TPR) repeat protein